MKRFLIYMVLLALLAVPVSARSGITSAQSQTVVSENGSCQVHLTFTIQLDSPDPDLTYPLPPDARDITVNGAPAFGLRGEDARRVSLSSAVSGAGTYTVAIAYRLPDVISAEKDELTLNLQLLSGFGYSIEDFSFTVTLPGASAAQPVFSSTYYQETVESVLQYHFTDGVLSGSFQARLQDHETLSLSLPVTKQMFPQSIAKQFHIDTLDLMMIFVAVVAIVYWLVALRCPRPRKIRASSAPEGITAGELDCQLTGRGANLTMMVLSWAQMGYLLIHLEDSGRVLLHKRMEMGNERSPFENQVFRTLFGKRKGVDGTGYHYARLCRKVAQSRPRLGEIFRKNSGNPGIFRILMALIGLLSGISLALSFAADTFWQVFLALILGAVAAGLSWLLQEGAMQLHSHNKLALWLSAAASALWLLLSVSGGEWNVALCVLPAQFLAGLAAGYGGRRTEHAMHNMSQILGLRRHLKNLPPEEMLRILKSNPTYYYDMAPYALALDVDRAFARKLGNKRLVGCSWLTTGMDGHLTAAEWNRLLRQSVTTLDALQLRLPFERFIGR